MRDIYLLLPLVKLFSGYFAVSFFLLSFLAPFFCDLVIFCSGMLWFLSLYLPCIYHRFCFFLCGYHDISNSHKNALWANNLTWKAYILTFPPKYFMILMMQFTSFYIVHVLKIILVIVILILFSWVVIYASSLQY